MTVVLNRCKTNKVDIILQKICISKVVHSYHFKFVGTFTSWHYGTMSAWENFTHSEHRGIIHIGYRNVFYNNNETDRQCIDIADIWELTIKLHYYITFAQSIIMLSKQNIKKWPKNIFKGLHKMKKKNKINSKKIETAHLQLKAAWKLENKEEVFLCNKGHKLSDCTICSICSHLW